MSTLTTAWASADTMLGCTNISLSYDFGVVMANLGETGHIRTSVDVGGVRSQNRLDNIGGQFYANVDILWWLILCGVEASRRPHRPHQRHHIVDVIISIIP